MANVHVRVALFVLLVQPFFVSQADEEPEYDYSKTEVVVSADYGKACAVALNDFESFKELRNNSFLSSYSIEIQRDGGRFRVWIHGKTPGFGGGAVYSIDAKTFKIMAKAYGK